MNIRIECSGYAPSDSFAIDLSDRDGGMLQIWDWPGARVGDEGGRMVAVDSRLVSEWCTGLRRLRMPAVSPSEQVTDAKQYRVTIVDGGTQAEYCWIEEAPRGWGGLYRIVRRIEATARNLK